MNVLRVVCIKVISPQGFGGLYPLKKGFPYGWGLFVSPGLIHAFDTLIPFPRESAKTPTCDFFRQKKRQRIRRIGVILTFAGSKTTPKRRLRRCHAQARQRDGMSSQLLQTLIAIWRFINESLIIIIITVTTSLLFISPSL